MNKSILIAIRLFLILTVITGIIYPLLITGISGIFFHDKAEGNLVKINGEVVGSKLIGQQFNSAVYFHSRPSAINYQTLPSGASNLSWSDNRLKVAVNLRKEAFLRENLLADTTTVPTEMLFASASGIDPHISPASAYLQMDRIALSRNFNDEQKLKLGLLITELKKEPQYSIFGEERINVFLLNLELDKIK
ncbi:MAG: potassium-transporting ATPase subunit KdpC [Bacteroidales bacterium]|nr:potassium-transporting ATPase subunit KdpC [Bacteroidales bacterium]